MNKTYLLAYRLEHKGESADTYLLTVETHWFFGMISTQTNVRQEIDHTENIYNYKRTWVQYIEEKQAFSEKGTTSYKINRIAEIVQNTCALIAVLILCIIAGAVAVVGYVVYRVLKYLFKLLSTTKGQTALHCAVCLAVAVWYYYQNEIAGIIVWFFLGALLYAAYSVMEHIDEVEKRRGNEKE